MQKVVAKPPRNYRPIIPQPLPAYEVSLDGTWQEIKTAEGKIPQNIWGAEEAMKGFHSHSNTSGRCCAISGLGRFAPENSKLAWSDPGLTISHIIPPQHFEVYPVDKSGIEDEDDELSEKWRMTWDPRENGIVLLGHFHDLWRARLVAIEPSTLTVRCFGPYDSIAAYEGKKAHFSNVPNRDALRWHYDMCVYENITAKQSRSLAATQNVETSAVVRPELSTSSAKTGPAPFTTSEVLPFAPPQAGTEEAARPWKRPRTGEDLAALPRLPESMESKDDSTTQLCTLGCILRLGEPTKSDPSCPNFSKHRRLGLGKTGAAVHKVDMATLSSWGLLRDKDVPKGQLCRESIISQYEVISRGPSPVLKVILPHGYTVLGKGVVGSGDCGLTTEEGVKEPPALTPLVEADILERLGPQLVGKCVPFCLGLIKLGKELRDPAYGGPIQSVLLLASARVPLSNVSLPRYAISEEIRRTVEDIRNRGVTFREPPVDADLRWNQEAQRVMVVNFAGAKIEATKDMDMSL